ncbi:MAG: hypothetical protein P4L93_09780 [Coriobacteriia bacterium]|nr:hypothetical protein [Coriobacteriia bacterium]
MAAGIAVALVCVCVFLGVILPLLSSWLAPRNSSQAPDVDVAQTRESVIADLKSAYGSQLADFNLDIDSSGMSQVRHHLKGVAIGVDRFLDSNDSVGDVGLAPPVASEPDKLSIANSGKLMTAWSTVTGRSVGRMLNFESVRKGDAETVTLPNWARRNRRRGAAKPARCAMMDGTVPTTLECRTVWPRSAH